MASQPSKRVASGRMGLTEVMQLLENIRTAKSSARTLATGEAGGSG